jgi:flagellar motor switch protein FliN/FliY
MSVNEAENKNQKNEEINPDSPALAADKPGHEELSASNKISANVAEFAEFDESNLRDKASTDKLQFLKDLQLNVYIELGRTQMQIKDILELERGYVIELDKLASEPVDIFVNNKKIAEGEVVVIDKHFGIRITNLNETNKDLAADKAGLKGLY